MAKRGHRGPDEVAGQLGLMGPVNWSVSRFAELPPKAHVMPPDWTLLPRPSCHALQAPRCRPGPPASHFPLPTLCSLSEASPMHLDDSYLGKPLERRHGRGGNTSLS